MPPLSRNTRGDSTTSLTFSQAEEMYGHGPPMSLMTGWEAEEVEPTRENEPETHFEYSDSALDTLEELMALDNAIEMLISSLEQARIQELASRPSDPIAAFLSRLEQEEQDNNDEEDEEVTITDSAVGMPVLNSSEDALDILHNSVMQTYNNTQEIADNNSGSEGSTEDISFGRRGRALSRQNRPDSQTVSGGRRLQRTNSDLPSPHYDNLLIESIASDTSDLLRPDMFRTWSRATKRRKSPSLTLSEESGAQHTLSLHGPRGFQCGCGSLV